MSNQLPPNDYIAASAGFGIPLTQTALAEFQTATDIILARADDAAIAQAFAEQTDLTLPKGDI